MKWVCIPVTLSNPLVSPISGNFGDWVGSIGSTKHFFMWLDSFLLLTFGGIPWQVYFQRVLSSKTATKAKILSYVAAIGCFIMAIPSVIIGAVAKNANWKNTTWEPFHNGTVYAIPDSMTKLTLPLVLHYLTPNFVAFVGLGAVSAAVMSSADSSVLSAASMFARNIWKLAIRPNASEREVLWVMKAGIIMVGILATVMALTIKSIYGLWYLSSDLVYVILFPQLLSVVYMSKVNTYGSIAGYAVGLIARGVGGEPLLDFSPIIEFWGFEGGTQFFPFKTMAMLLSLGTLTFVSYLTHYLFMNGFLAPEYDVFMCVVNIPLERRILRDVSLATSTETLANMSGPGQKAAAYLAGGAGQNGGVTNPLLLSARYSGGQLSGASTPSTETARQERIPLTASSRTDHQSTIHPMKYDAVEKSTL
uniref:High-affinity choline transporter 1 n=1 Tax=Romanomermis culicivorax TaxID=13658 RepID=A0A915JCU9_ROMCU